MPHSIGSAARIAKCMSCHGCFSEAIEFLADILRVRGYEDTGRFLEGLTVSLGIKNPDELEVTLKEASAAGVSIYAYDRNNAACKAYETLTKEVIQNSFK